MTLKSVESIVRRLASGRWSWNRASWTLLAADLALRECAREGNRISYETPEAKTLSAFFAQGDALAFVEVTVEAFVDVEELSEEAYEEKVDEYYEKFMRAVAEAERVLGKPSFCNGAAARGFPEDQDAVWLALWRVENARLMLQQTHEDQELPFRICVVVAPLVG